MDLVNGICVSRLARHHDTDDIAQGVMLVHLDAYVHRFGEEHRDALRQALGADPQHHIQATREQLRAGSDKGWHWVIALQEVRGLMVVRGFALCIVLDSDIFLAEIHTHPQAQRQGLGRCMLREVLRFVADGPHGLKVAGLPVMLNVARQTTGDDTEHPFAWYRSLGFVVDGPGEDIVAGALRLPTVRMRSSMGRILAKLAD